ncbi:Receptor expression-enhancing protein 5, partial [Phytophthora boehmeriae]
DSDHEIGKKALERVKTMLLTEGDALSDKSSIKCAVSTYIGGPTLRGILERIQWVFEEANVLAVENFYDYSTTKYQVVLGCLEELRARPELFISDEKAISVVLRELEISCHLNIASGCLEMQRNYMKGLNHCDQVLNLDSSHAVCHFRKGQLYQALHNYDKALASLGTAKSLLSGVEGEQRSDEQQKSMLATVDKEIDKCNFARHQYDIKYLRSLATAQTTK